MLINSFSEINQALPCTSKKGGISVSSAKSRYFYASAPLLGSLYLETNSVVKMPEGLLL
jgi:hypothetical protein